MKIVKNQVKTWNSQQSDIDHNSKLENSFLQKFVKYLLADTLESSLIPLYDHLGRTKVSDRTSRHLLNDLFLLTRPLPLPQMSSQLVRYLTARSPSFQAGELNHLFDLRWSSCAGREEGFEAGELAVIEVRIKADIQKIQELPLRVEERLVAALGAGAGARRECPVSNFFRSYRRENINILLVYFGEYNFQLVQKKFYQRQEVILLGRKYNLRIYVFFISKLALLETFRHINRLHHLDSLNDITIQIYQMKRERAKRKKEKKEMAKSKHIQGSRSQQMALFKDYGFKAIIGIAMVGAAVLIRKILK